MATNNEEHFDPCEEVQEERPAEGVHILQVTAMTVTRSKSRARWLMNVLDVRTVRNPAGDLAVGGSLREWYVPGSGRVAKVKLRGLLGAVDPKLLTTPAAKGGYNWQDQASVTDHLVGRLFLAKVYHEPDKWTDSEGEERVGVNVRLDLDSYAPLTKKDRAAVVKRWGSPDGPTVGGEEAGDEWAATDLTDEEIPF